MYDNELRARNTNVDTGGFCSTECKRPGLLDMIQHFALRISSRLVHYGVYQPSPRAN
jgi:hypothetical protein